MNCLNHARTIALAVLFTIFNVRGETVLSLDVNSRAADTPGNTLSGFSSFTMRGAAGSIQSTPTTRTYGALSVTVVGIAGSAGSRATANYEDRNRATPLNSGAFTCGALLRDFIFSRDTTNGGLDITVSGLASDASYRFTVWSFDSNSPGHRASDWSANGNLVVSNYAFNGAVLPTNNVQYSFSFTAAADGDGEVIISGRHNSATVDATGAASFGVFFNGMQIETATTSPPLPRKRSAAENRSPIE